MSQKNRLAIANKLRSASYNSFWSYTHMCRMYVTSHCLRTTHAKQRRSVVTKNSALMLIICLYAWLCGFSRQFLSRIRVRTQESMWPRVRKFDSFLAYPSVKNGKILRSVVLTHYHRITVLK